MVAYLNPSFTEWYEDHPHLILSLTRSLSLSLTKALTLTLTLTRYEEGALLRSEDCMCAAATVVSALQAFD